MKRVRIRLKKDLSDDFIKLWKPSIKPFMVKGWETWVGEYEWDLKDAPEDLDLHPEDNKYLINFEFEQFEEVL